MGTSSQPSEPRLVRPWFFWFSSLLLGIFAALALFVTPSRHQPAESVPPENTPATAATGTAPLEARVPLLAQKEAWERVSPFLEGRRGPLPAWARALSDSLPQTTAAMLALDTAHHRRSPLGAELRGRLRWVVAHTTGSAYGEALARADLRRAGLNAEQLQNLRDSQRDLPAMDRAALEFARDLIHAPDRITDADVARLIAYRGEAPVVALVLWLAYCDFQNRLALALDLPVGTDEELPALEVQYVRPLPGTARVVAPRPRQRSAPGQRPSDWSPGRDWLALDYDSLQHALEKQKERQARIRLPDAQGGNIQWGLVCQTYQPELAAAWSAVSQAFGAEAEQDPVFEASLFWVITHAVRCFY